MDPQRGVPARRSLLIKELRGLAIRAPIHNGKPTTNLSLYGLKGVGKSSWLQAVFTVLLASATCLTPAGGGAEADAGTTQCRPWHLHLFLWPDDKDPPAHVYVWDVRGLKAENVTTDQAVAGTLEYLATGDLPENADNLYTRPPRGTVGFGKDLDGILMVVSADDAMADPSAEPPSVSILLMRNVRSWVKAQQPSTQLVAVNTCGEAVSPANVTDRLKSLGKVVGLPFTKCFVTTHADVLTPKPTDQLLPEEQHIIAPLLQLMQDVTKYNLNAKRRTDLVLDPIKWLRTIGLCSAAQAVEDMGFTGATLLDLSEAEFLRIFGEYGMKPGEVRRFARVCGH